MPYGVYDKVYYDNHRKERLVYQSRYAKGHKKAKRTYDKNYRRKNKSERQDYMKNYFPKYRKKLAKQVFAHYGGKCRCCGEGDWHFLTLSHPNNDGAKQRKELGGKGNAGVWFYRWLIENDFPTEYEIVAECFNCNMARARNGGICPHAIP